jgi:hypothetical protein
MSTSTDRSTIQRANLPYAGVGSQLVRIGQAYYVRAQYAGYNVPEMHANYYKVVRVTADPYRPMPDLAEAIAAHGYAELQDRGQGNYCLSVGTFSRCYLAIDYSACAEYIDDYPVPCPKVRKGIQTRWNNQGYWEKYLKAEGWIRA